MGILNQTDKYQTLRVKIDQEICFIQLYRPQANNTINDQMVDELINVLDEYDASCKIIVLEGTPEVFCFGADFQAIQESNQQHSSQEQNPEPLYDLWLRLANGPFVSIAHVRGKTNAGGVGFVAACDIVLCEEQAIFSLSELLFGLMPACVLPFLVKRTGISKANYLTLMTQPISAKQALEWGLVDACETNSSNLLRKHLLRLKRLRKPAISRFKNYMAQLDNSLAQVKPLALAANKEVFSDTENLRLIDRYVTTGKFPWEGD